MATNNATNTSQPITVAQGGTGDTTLTTAYGTLCAGTTATGPIQTVSPGTTGQALVSAGAAALPAYGTLGVTGGGTGVATLTTAYGTLCAGTTATGTVQTVSPGTAGWVLTSNGAAALPTYQAAGGGGGALTFIATVTSTVSTAINFNNNLTSTYDNYLIVMENAYVNGGNEILQLQIGTGAGPTYQTTNYSGVLIAAVYSSGVPNQTVIPSGTSAMDLTPNANGGFTMPGSGGGTIVINGANIGSITITGNYNYLARDAVTSVAQTNLSLFSGKWTVGTTVTSLRLVANSQPIVGTFKLYGYQN